ncbi:hypothetical protein E2C01_096251 [Portunus trituberculatus]|uniref:Uncharacterized protein n=1 Tax=Portunus trituberculatus TaxID=210409 RepID=A0A5B7K1J2_PORTR|nr:hypothetical protein [Portunus trituberculatus]
MVVLLGLSRETNERMNEAVKEFLERMRTCIHSGHDQTNKNGSKTYQRVPDSLTLHCTRCTAKLRLRDHLTNQRKHSAHMMLPHDYEAAILILILMLQVARDRFRARPLDRLLP